MVQTNCKFNNTETIPIKCFVSHRPTDPFFGKVKKKKKKSESLVKKQVLSLQAHDLVLLTPIALNYHRYFDFVLFLLYHLITEERTT